MKKTIGAVAALCLLLSACAARTVAEDESSLPSSVGATVVTSDSVEVMTTAIVPELSTTTIRSTATATETTPPTTQPAATTTTALPPVSTATTTVTTQPSAINPLGYTRIVDPDKIAADARTYVESLGMIWDPSRTKDNSTWSTASAVGSIPNDSMEAMQERLHEIVRGEQAYRATRIYLLVDPDIYFKGEYVFTILSL